MEQIADELRRFVIDNFLYGRDVRFSDDDSFLTMGIIDSTGLLELVNFLETTYDIDVNDADLVPQNLDSIAGLTQFVQRKLEHRESAAVRALATEIIYSD